MFNIKPGQAQNDQHGGGNKADAAQEQAHPAGAHIPDVDRHFCRIGTGDQVGRAQQIEELFIRQPFTAEDDFIVHDRNVRGRSAKRSESQLEKKRGNLNEGRHGLSVLHLQAHVSSLCLLQEFISRGLYYATIGM